MTHWRSGGLPGVSVFYRKSKGPQESIIESDSIGDTGRQALWRLVTLWRWLLSPQAVASGTILAAHEFERRAVGSSGGGASIGPMASSLAIDNYSTARPDLAADGQVAAVQGSVV